MLNSKTAAEFNADAAKHTRDADESFDRCDTDGFVSQWASGINARVAQANARIAANGGTATFWRFVALDADTLERLPFRRANTRFGFKLVVDTPKGEVWIDPDAKRPETNTRKGVIVERESFVAPAHAATWAPPGARGLSGATSVTVRTFPDDRNVVWDGVCP